MAAAQHWNPRNLYLYLVCLITLVISIFAAVQLVRSGVELIYPDPGYYGEMSTPKGSEAESAAQLQSVEDSQRRQGILGLVGSATTLLITGPLYLYHWRRIERERPAPTSTD